MRSGGPSYEEDFQALRAHIAQAASEGRAAARRAAADRRTDPGVGYRFEAVSNGRIRPRADHGAFTGSVCAAPCS